MQQCRSQLLRGPRRRSAAVRMLRLWVRIPPRAWMFVCCECCVLSGRGLWDALITRPEESYRLWCVAVCDLETSRMRRPWPVLGRSDTGGGKNATVEFWFIHCKATLHVSGVTAPIIRSIKNCNRSFRYWSQYRYSYFPPTWPDRGTVPEAAVSFYYSWWWVLWHPKHVE